MRTLNKFGRGGLIASFIAGSMLLGGAAHAADVGLEAGRKITISKSDSVLNKSSRLIDIIDTALAVTDKGLSDKSKVFAQLYRTGVHESGGLEHLVQGGGGPARSFFQVEPTTAADVVQRWAAKKGNEEVLGALEKTSGLSSKKLLSMSKGEFGELLTRNQIFAASVARYRYKMSPGTIPSSLADQADYWQKAYQRGGSKVAKKRIQGFVKSNMEFSDKVNAAVLAMEKIKSKGGTATSKAKRFIRKILPR